MCVNNNVLSVDHLEVITDEDVEALKKSMENKVPTFPVALPICLSLSEYLILNLED